MQDLKNLSQKSRFPNFKPFSTGNRNKRLNSNSEPKRFRLPFPVGKQLRKLKLALVFLAVVLALTPVCIVTLRHSKTPLQNIAGWLTSLTEATPKQVEAARQPRGQSTFALAGSLLENAEMNGDQLTARTSDGLLLNYTVQGGLQKRVHDFLAKNQVPYGVFVAIEPATGRILGMTSYSSVDPAWTSNSAYGLYPMASLFKIITASAALESRKITPDSVVEFRGGSTSETPRYWEISPRGKNNRLDVTYAMGKSINPVYGRIASDIAGKTSVMESVSRFGFNQELLPETPAKPSQASEPQTNNDLMLMGAGLDHDVKISPLHAAVIMSAIANGGRMMAPVLTSSVSDDRGQQKETFIPREIRRLVSPETASSLTRMLSSTVLTGTSRRAFHDRRGRLLLDVSIAAKTGSINGDNPKGHYSWFAAFAPLENPRIALVALVINPDKWKIKASQVGQQALEEFFEK
ncbi:MAG: penicillin-binding transpeptidase domain-containing protein [Geobacteraceae bacterium]|nr:penicillin-binding transpeptidase domain-containing protein [Geobacteraceae bacterium]